MSKKEAEAKAKMDAANAAATEAYLREEAEKRERAAVFRANKRFQTFTGNHENLLIFMTSQGLFGNLGS